MADAMTEPHTPVAGLPPVSMCSDPQSIRQSPPLDINAINARHLLCIAKLFKILPLGMQRTSVAETEGLDDVASYNNGSLLSARLGIKKASCGRTTRVWRAQERFSPRRRLTSCDSARPPIAAERHGKRDRIEFRLT